MKITVGKKIAAAFGTAIVALAIIGGTAYQSTRQLVETAGLVTHGPSRIFRVAFAIKVNSGYGSFHSTWESKIQPYSNPAASAC